MNPYGRTTLKHLSMFKRNNAIAHICLRQPCSNEMIRACKSCGKEFQSFNEGVIYANAVSGTLDFCSDICCMDYLNSATKNKKET